MHPPSPGIWTEVDVAGKLADIYEPAQPHSQPRVVLHLHGHGLTTLHNNTAFTAELERHGLRCICPHGQRSWWGQRICREYDPVVSPEQYLRGTLLPYIFERWNARPPFIALMGISMGGQGALRMSYRFPREFPIVVAISPAIDFQKLHGHGLPLDEMYPTAESARQDTATLEIHPLNWPRHQLLVCDPADADWYESAERLASKLSSSGIPFESDLKTTYGGHSWSYFDRMAPLVMNFIAESLAMEAARVVA